VSNPEYETLGWKWVPLRNYYWKNGREVRPCLPIHMITSIGLWLTRHQRERGMKRVELFEWFNLLAHGDYQIRS